MQQDRIDTREVAYRALVQRQSVGRDGDAVGVVLARQHGVGEAQRRAAAAAGVVGLHWRAADHKRERGPAVGRGHLDGLVEGDRDGDDVARVEQPVLDAAGRGDGHGADGGRGRVDAEAERPAARAEVAGGVDPGVAQRARARGQGRVGRQHTVDKGCRYLDVVDEEHSAGSTGRRRPDVQTGPGVVGARRHGSERRDDADVVHVARGRRRCARGRGGVDGERELAAPVADVPGGVHPGEAELALAFGQRHVGREHAADERRRHGAAVHVEDGAARVCRGGADVQARACVVGLRGSRAAAGDPANVVAVAGGCRRRAGRRRDVHRDRQLRAAGAHVAGNVDPGVAQLARAFAQGDVGREHAVDERGCHAGAVDIERCARRVGGRAAQVQAGPRVISGRGCGTRAREAAGVVDVADRRDRHAGRRSGVDGHRQGAAERAFVARGVDPGIRQGVTAFAEDGVRGQHTVDQGGRDGLSVHVENRPRGVGRRAADVQPGTCVVGRGSRRSHAGDATNVVDIGGGRGRRSGRRRGVDKVVGIRADLGTGEVGVDPGSVADRCAIAGQGVGRDRDPIAVGLPGLDGVGEAQGRGARALHIGRLHERAADVERQGRRGAAGHHGHGLVEADRGRDRVASVQRAALRAGRTAQNHRAHDGRRRVHGHRMARAGRPDVTRPVGHLGIELVGAARGKDRGRDVDVAVADVVGRQAHRRAQRRVAVAQLHGVASRRMGVVQADAHDQIGVIAGAAGTDRAPDLACVVADLGDGRRAGRRGVNPEARVVGHGQVRRQRIHAGRVAHRRAVEVQRVRTEGDAIRVGLAGLDGVAEAQRRRAGAAAVKRLHRHAADLQRDMRRAAGGHHVHGLVERDRHRQHVTSVQQPVLDTGGARQRDTVDGGGADVDGDRVLGTARAGVPGQVGQHRVEAVGAATGQQRRLHVDIAVGDVDAGQRHGAAQQTTAITQLHRVARGRAGAIQGHAEHETRVVGDATDGHGAGAVADVVTDAGDRRRKRRGRVDQETRVAGNGAMVQHRVDASEVAHRPAIGGERARRDGDAGVVGLAGDDGVTERQRRRARAAGVDRLHRRAADGERQRGLTARSIDRHDVIEADGGGDDVADVQAPVAQPDRAAQRHGAHRRRADVDTQCVAGAGRAGVAGEVGQPCVELVGGAGGQHGGDNLDVAVGDVAGAQRDRVGEHGSAVAQLHRVTRAGACSRQADSHHRPGVIGRTARNNRTAHGADVVADEDDGGRQRRRGVHEIAGISGHRGVREVGVDTRRVSDAGAVVGQAIGWD